MMDDRKNRNGTTPQQPGWRRGAATIRALFYRLAAVDAGAVAAEYAFLIAFISIIAAIGMVLLGGDLRLYFEALATSLENASQPTPAPFAT